MKLNKALSCGVKFCGGCNSRYDRMEALEKVKSIFNGKVNFDFAKEETKYDFLFIIGGCTNCCASYSQYESERSAIRMWDASCIERVLSDIEKYIKMEAKASGLEENL